MLEVLAWPGAIVVIATIFFLIFKRPLSSLIYRTEKVTKEGFEASPQSQAERALDGEDRGDGTRELYEQLDNTLVVRAERMIREELDNRDIHDPEDREGILVRYLASLSTAATFLDHYQAIYGSQIRTLEYLNTAGQNGVSIDRVRETYEEAKEAWPSLYKDGQTTFADWLGFLIASSLVRRDGDRVAITIEGREFLKFLTERGFSKQKFF